MEDVSHMTGEKNYKRPPKGMVLNEIRFNGKDGGGFRYVDLKNKREGEKAEEKLIGKSINVVFIKIRKKFAYYDKAKELFISTNEFNKNEDTVWLYGVKERGVAKDLRTKYDKLRTVQVVYALLIDGTSRDQELVRVIIKGSTLNGSRKGATCQGFYDFISSTEEGTHNYQYVTTLTEVEETGENGKHFVISFTRAKKIADENLPKVIAKIKEVDAFTTEQDAYYNGKNAITPEPAKEVLPTIEYPEEEINPDDIPF